MKEDKFFIFMFDFFQRFNHKKAQHGMHCYKTSQKNAAGMNRDSQ